MIFFVALTKKLHKDAKKFHIIITFFLYPAFLFTIIKAVDFIPGCYQLIKMPGYLFITASSLLACWIIIRGKHLRIFKNKDITDYKGSKYIHRIAFIVTLAVFVLNIAVFIDNKINTPAGPNILLIVVDCLRAKDLGCYGGRNDISPGIDQLAHRGVIFRNAFSTAPWTKPSIASLFTSLYPNVHNVINIKDALSSSLLTLPERLRNEGYATYFFNGGNYFIDTGFNFNQGFNVYRFSKKIGDASVLAESFLSYVSGLKKKKFFAYLHYMDSHIPYRTNDKDTVKHKKEDSFHSFNYNDLNTPYEIGAFCKYIRGLSAENKLIPDDKYYIKAQYENAIRYIDKSIERIVTELRENDLLQNTVILLTADHGEEFWEHGSYEHGHTLYNELLQVPLIITGGGVDPGEVESNVRLIDISPSILEMVQADVTSCTMQGLSLLQIINGRCDELPLPVFAIGTLYGDEKLCLIKGTVKLIFSTGNTYKKLDFPYRKVKENYELYDLHNDPFESNNVRKTDNQTFSALKESLLEFKNVHNSFQPTEVTIDSDLRKKLEAIGYVQ
jgi:arylsulfatase A-like enzyme